MASRQKKVQTVFFPFEWKIFSLKKKFRRNEILKENKRKKQKRFNNSCLVRPMCYIVRVLNESLSGKEFSSEFWNDFNFFFGPSVKQNNLRMCLKCHLLSHFTISVEHRVIWPKIRQETIFAVFFLSHFGWHKMKRSYFWWIHNRIVFGLFSLISVHKSGYEMQLIQHTVSFTETNSNQFESIHNFTWQI